MIDGNVIATPVMVGQRGGAARVMPIVRGGRYENISLLFISLS